MTASRNLLFLGLAQCLLVIAVMEKIQICKKIDLCQCRYTNGSIVNLWPLVQGTKKSEPLFTDVKHDGDNFYSYNPCRPFSNDKCVDAVMCKTEGNLTAKVADTNVQFHMKGFSLGLTYNYRNYTTIVDLRCDPMATKPTFESYGFLSDPKKPKFLLTSSHACARESVTSGSSGLSAGGIILIIFFVFLFLYLVVGILNNKCRHNATGFEILPHYQFWSSLPGLVTDGLGYVITCACCKPRPKHHYDEV